MDTSGEAGSKKDKTGSATTSTKKSSGKKRKTSLLTSGDSETLPKPKRQRKKKKSATDIASQDIASLDAPPGSKSGKQEKLPVRSVPPGEALPLAMTSADRNVTPVKANDEQFSRTQFHPRSITKGIGFLPINAVSGASSTVTTASAVTSATSDSLDVLATVSTSLRTNERSVIRSFIGNKRLPAGGGRQFADENQQQSSDDSPTTIGGYRQLTIKNGRVDDSSTSINSNRQFAEENQQHTNIPSKSADAARLGPESFSISANRTQVADVGVTHTTIDGSQIYSDELRSLNKLIQSAAERSSKENQVRARLFSNASDISTNIGQEDALSDLLFRDKTDPISTQLVNVQTAPNSSEMVKDEAVDSSSLGMNASVNKTKKSKKDRQKKAKKTKIQGPDSSGETTPKAKDGLPAVGSNTARDGEQSIDGPPKPIGELCSTHDDENKTKQIPWEVNALSLDLGEQNGSNAAAVNSTDIEMKEMDEQPELSTLKHLVPGSLNDKDIPCKQIQDSSKPIDPTCAVISQDIQPLNYDETLLSSKPIDETLALKGKQKNKERSSGKKSGKKESKSKPDGGKTKKLSEKKPKTPQGKKQEKETVTKSGKKSSKVKGDKVLTKTKETDNKHEETENDKLISVSDVSADVDAIEISSGSDETTMLNISQKASNAIKMLGTMFSNNEFSDDKVKVNRLEQPVVSAKESKTSEATDNKSTQPVDSIEDLSSISQKNSELDSSKDHSNKEDDTSEITGKVSVNEVPKKQKNKTSKSHTKKSTSEKDKKKTAKEEKSTKYKKKSGKKSEKNNIKSLENNSVSTENEAGTASVIDKDSIMAVDEIVSPAADESVQKRLVQEQASEETKSVTPELATTDAVVKENGIEERRNSEDIVFINDQSVGNFVKAQQDVDISESSLSRKRKRCTSPQRNDSVVSENSGKVSLQFFIIAAFHGKHEWQMRLAPLLLSRDSWFSSVFRQVSLPQQKLTLKAILQEPVFAVICKAIVSMTYGLPCRYFSSRFIRKAYITNVSAK